MVLFMTVHNLISSQCSTVIFSRYWLVAQDRTCYETCSALFIFGNGDGYSEIDWMTLKSLTWTCSGSLQRSRDGYSERVGYSGNRDKAAYIKVTLTSQCGSFYHLVVYIKKKKGDVDHDLVLIQRLDHRWSLHPLDHYGSNGPDDHVKKGVILVIRLDDILFFLLH